MMCLPVMIQANTSFFANNSYNISARFIGGYILPLSKNLEKVATNPSFGAEVSLEFPRLSQHSWYRYWNCPTVGVAVAYHHLGNDAILGSAVAVYPYLLIPIFETEVVRFDYKMGAGLSFFNKTWNRCDTLSGVYSETANSAIGSIVNAYLTTGFGLGVRFNERLNMKLSLDYVHASNGSFLQPNSGINMMTASLGMSYTFNDAVAMDRVEVSEPYPYLWSLSFSLGGGIRELYYKDDKKYGVGSFHVGATYHLAPYYALGGGFDVFYDGVFVRQGTTADMSADMKAAQQQHTHFNRYLIMEDAVKNKFRAGVCLSNEFVIGRLTGLLDWGVYLYDPVKRGNKMFYKYDINKEDGWNYFRLGLRCRVAEGLYLQTTLKTHLQKAEFVDFGIGYTIRFKKGN